MVASTNVMESSGSVVGLLEAARLAVETAPSPAARLARMEALAARVRDAEAARDRLHAKLSAGWDRIEDHADADERFERWERWLGSYERLVDSIAAAKLLS